MFWLTGYLQQQSDPKSWQNEFLRDTKEFLVEQLFTEKSNWHQQKSWGQFSPINFLSQICPRCLPISGCLDSEPRLVCAKDGIIQNNAYKF